MMRWERFLRLTAVLLFAATVMVGFQIQWVEARGYGGHQGYNYQGSSGGFNRYQYQGSKGSSGGFNRYQYQGSSYFLLGLGLGLGVPYAYPGYQPYRYPAYPYASYPAYYGACYAYDAYGRCLGYAPAGGY